MHESKLTLTANDLKVLSALHTEMELYGLQIKNAVDSSGAHLYLGSLYNLLARLEAQNLVESRSGESTEKRGEHKRRYYRLTDLGKSAVDQYQRQFLKLWKLEGATFEN